MLSVLGWAVLRSLPCRLLSHVCVLTLGAQFVSHKHRVMKRTDTCLQQLALAAAAMVSCGVGDSTAGCA